VEALNHSPTLPTLKINRMTLAMCRGSQCGVVDRGGKTDSFDIKSGVRQWCVMSSLFFACHCLVTRKALEERNTGIRWSFTEKFNRRSRFR